jgi:hypothetical protein
MVDEKELRQENKKIRYLRIIVDLSLHEIRQGKLTLDQVYALMEGVRKLALRLFPDKEEEFDLIYGSRFQRVVREYYHIQ